MSAIHDVDCRVLIKQAAVAGKIDMIHVTENDILEIELALMSAIRIKKTKENLAVLDEYASVYNH